MTPQLRPEIRPKTRLGGHSAAGPRSPKRRIKSRNRVTSACHVVGRVARNSGGLRPLPLGHGTTWISSQLRGACASGPAGGAVSSSPRPWRRAQLTWQIISGAVKRPQSGFRSGAKRAMRSRTASRAWGSKREGIARLSEESGSSLTDRAYAAAASVLCGAADAPLSLRPGDPRSRRYSHRGPRRRSPSCPTESS